MTLPLFTVDSPVADLEDVLNPLVLEINTLDAGAGRSGATGATVWPVTSLSALDALSAAVVGDIAFMTAPGTGIDALKWDAYAGSGSGLDWRPAGTVIADTKAHLDTFIAAVAAIGDTRFQVGSAAFVTGTTVRYRFTSAVGAYVVDAFGTIVPAVAGTGVSVDATTGLVTFTSATAITLDSTFSADFSRYEIILDSTGTSASLTMIMRTSAPADDVSSHSDFTGSLNRNATITAQTTASGAGWLLGFGIANTRHHLHCVLSNPFQSVPVEGDLVAHVHSSPVVQNVSNAVATLALSHQDSTSFPGMKLTFSAAQTGTLMVRGLF